VTTTPATTRPNTAIGLLFGPAEIAAGSLAILSDATNANLDRALQGLPPAARATAVKEVRATAAGLLDINLIDMLIAGWRTYHDLTSAARRTVATPGSKELVSLVTHRVTAEQQPSVKVLVNGQPVATVRLKFSADFDVSALLAEITEGRMVAIHTGRCDITATLAVDDIDVATGQTRLELPGAIPVTPGIRLLPAGDYPSGAGQPGATPAEPGVPQPQPAVLSSSHAALPSQSATPGGEWWKATGAVSPPPTQGGEWSEAAGAATPPAATPPAAAPAAADTPKKAGSSKRWWER
jgi:hypothetical protein